MIITFRFLYSSLLQAKVVVALAIITAVSTIASIIFRIVSVVKFRRIKEGTEDKEKLVFLHFSFSLILEFALFALSVLLANITMTMYKIREIIDGIGTPTGEAEAETNSMVSNCILQDSV